MDRKLLIADRIVTNAYCWRGMRVICILRLGYGMNTGVSDGVDLGWKLALCCRDGWRAPDRQLRAERRRSERSSPRRSQPHPAPNDFSEQDSKSKAAPRGSAAKNGERIIYSKKREFTRSARIGTRYKASPIILLEAEHRSHRRTVTIILQSARVPGAASVASGDRSLYDLFGSCFALIAYSDVAC